MNHALTLRQPLTKNASANPLDVMMMKSALGVLGHYEAPEWGVTQFPDAALYSAIENFQKSAGLTVDGVMKPEGPTEDTLRETLTNHQSATALHITARSLQDLGRNGDEILAHITPEEAQLLHRITDGASINPKTGLLEFWYDYEADAAGVGDTASNTGPDRDDGKDNNHGPTTKKNGQGTPASALNTATTGPVTPTTVPNQTPRQARPVTVPDDDPSFTSNLFNEIDDWGPPEEKDPWAEAASYLFETITRLFQDDKPEKLPPAVGGGIRG